MSFSFSFQRPCQGPCGRTKVNLQLCSHHSRQRWIEVHLCPLCDTDSGRVSDIRSNAPVYTNKAEENRAADERYRTTDDIEEELRDYSRRRQYKQDTREYKTMKTMRQKNPSMFASIAKLRRSKRAASSQNTHSVHGMILRYGGTRYVDDHNEKVSKEQKHKRLTSLAQSISRKRKRPATRRHCEEEEEEDDDNDDIDEDEPSVKRARLEDVLYDEDSDGSNVSSEHSILDENIVDKDDGVEQSVSEAVSSLSSSTDELHEHLHSPATVSMMRSCEQSPIGSERLDSSSLDEADLVAMINEVCAQQVKDKVKAKSSRRLDY